MSPVLIRSVYLDPVMSPIRRILAFVVLILLVLLFTSPDGPRSLLASQEIGLFCASSTAELQLNLSTSTQVETSIPGSELVIGFTLLDRLYLRNGTFFIVTANLSAFPPRSNMIAPAMDLGSGNASTQPTDKVLIPSDHCYDKLINNNTSRNSV
jgi:hypothetical protein